MSVRIPRAALAALIALSLPLQWGCEDERRSVVTAPDPKPFEELARQGVCADIRNRLFLIDDTLVLWDKAGNCADGAYEQTLFGATPEQVLCRYGDSIAGPRKECRNPAVAPLFDTILAHLDQPDLGLGPRHTVRPIPF
jgi:hypothetical protein